jgi:hypothetical protein
MNTPTPKMEIPTVISFSSADALKIQKKLRDILNEASELNMPSGMLVGMLMYEIAAIHEKIFAFSTLLERVQAEKNSGGHNEH